MAWKGYIKAPSEAVIFVIFCCIEKPTQFPRLFPIGVKFGRIRLQVIVSSMSNFRENRVYIYKYFCACAMNICNIP